MADKRLSPRNWCWDGVRGCHWRKGRAEQTLQSRELEQRCPGQALYEAGAAPWQLRADQGSPDEVGDALSHSRSYIPIFHSQADFHRPVFRTAAPANAEDITQQLLELEREDKQQLGCRDRDPSELMICLAPLS